MNCPICGCWVDSEERLHEHYLSNCPGNPGDEMEKPGVAVRLLWNRTVTTLATEVFLLSDFSKDPMPLQWNIPDDVFESELVAVPVGLHQCQLVVGDDIHPVRKFVVEEATREVPLEILSDIAKDADRDSVDTDSLDRYSGSSAKDTKSSVRFADNFKRDQPGAVGGVSRPTANGKPPPWSVKGRALIQEKLASKASLSTMDGGRSYSQDGRSSTASIVDRYSRPGSGNLNGYAGLNGINANGDRLSGSRGSTPPASVTSEQELSQYFDQGREGGYRGGTGRGSVDDVSSHHSRHSRSSSARSSIRQSPVTLPSSSEQVRPREYGKRSSSVPTVQDIDRFTSDKRSYTPDTYSRLANSSTSQPIALSPLVTTRTAPVTSTVSRSSSHRSTPLSTHSSRLTNGGVENGHRQNCGGDQCGRVQQLEEELAMTKSQLTDRDRDYTHLSEQLQQEQDVRLGLEQELDQIKRDQHNGAAMEIVELERKYSDILREKENLATEVFTLRRALDESQSASRHPGESSFTEYDPNNPTVLLKKIEDLESQVRDLQEANECAVGELSRAEQEADKMKEENESLRTVNDLSIGDLREENQNLKEQIVLLTKQHQQQSHNLFNTSDLGLDEEVKQLRQTCRQLREKNHELNEENLRQRDELRDMRRKRERAQSDKSDLQEKMERYKQERQTARDEVNALNAELTKVKAQLSVYTANTPRILDQSVGISSPKIHSTPTNVLPSRFDPSPLIGSKLNGSVEDQHHSRRSFERKTSPSAYNGWDAKDALDGSPQSDASDSTTLLLAPWRPHEGFGATDDAESLIGTDTGLGSTKESSAFSSHPYPDADGYSSTDIESHSAPYRDVHIMGSSKGRRRSNSISSSSDISSFDTDTDKDYGRYSSKARQKRSGSGERSPRSRKDYIGKSSSLQSLPTMSSDTEGLLAEPPTGRRSKRSSPRGPSPPGFRSVSPKAIATQHNRDYHTMSSSTPNLSVPSRPPFVPRSPGDVQVGYKCKFSRPGGKISKGSVMYVGHLPGRSEAYLGVELDSEDGKHDGVYNGQRFFVCKPNKGVFVSFNKVIMVWG
ncbi:CLIP2 [Branchiostoma lanceolatum]|uniref:CLIP2 protein n=2 Tax=Branchiostoma lanceolatum TaxID=7740 RepID=A0A8J9VKE5_BRALA|nr:CLIP2 [Branchiostoma lanceolatum]